MTGGKPESKSYFGSWSESSQLSENEEISAAAFHVYSLPSFPLTFCLCCKKETQMVKSCPSNFPLTRIFLTHCTYWAHPINQHFLSTPFWTAKAVVRFKIYTKTVPALKWFNSSYLSNSSLRPKYFYGQPQNTIRLITTATLTCSSVVPAWRVWLWNILHADLAGCDPNSVLNHGYSEPQMWGHNPRAESVPCCLGTKW